MSTRMRRILLAGAAVLAAALLALHIACSAPRPSSRDTSSTAENAGLPTIKIGIDYLEPFFYVARNGEYAGIDADISREACSRAGLNPQFIKLSWSDRDEYLANGKVDCLWCGFASNGRTDLYHWTSVYLETPVGMMVRANDPATSPHDFAGTEGVAVRAGSISEFSLVIGSYGVPATVPIKSFGTMDMAEAALENGYADAWISYASVLERKVAQSSGKYRILDDSLMLLDLAVAFDVDYNGPYVDKLDDALYGMRQDGTIDKIVQKYSEQNADGTGDFDE